VLRRCNKRFSAVEAENGQLKSRVSKLEAKGDKGAVPTIVATRPSSVMPAVRQGVATGSPAASVGDEEHSPRDWPGVYIEINAR